MSAPNDTTTPSAVGPLSEADAMLAEPPLTDGDIHHPLFKKVADALREVYDPEIPVNIYELGLIYLIEFDEANNVAVKMTLTAPGCPVAGEMPGWVEDAAKKVPGIGAVAVDLTWDPPWNPAMMAETARLALNMY